MRTFKCTVCAHEPTYARSHLSELLNRVESGHEQVITRLGKDVARLLPIHQATLKEPIPLEELADFRSTMPELRRSCANLIREMSNESK